jgi:hypothetical protein
MAAEAGGIAAGGAGDAQAAGRTVAPACLMEAQIRPGKPATSCADCLAWGVLPGRTRRSCSTFNRLHQPGDCAACGRIAAIKKGYCRLCWLQASFEAKALGRVTAMEPILRQVRCQQLFFSGMHRIRQPGPLLGKQGRRKTALRAGPHRPRRNPGRLGPASAAHQHPARLLAFRPAPAR